MSSQPNKPRQSLFRLLILLTLVIAAFFAYQSWRGSERKAFAGLPRLGRAPDFVLTNQDGNSIGVEQLKGKIWVANFICTRCAGADQIMSSHFAELDRNFTRNDVLRLVTFTLDPEHDTPGILKRYAREYEASERWFFLTGNKKQIDDLVTSGFQAKAPTARKENDQLRKTTFVLVDRDGVIRSYYDGTSVEVVPRLLTDLGSLLRVSEK